MAIYSRHSARKSLLDTVAFRAISQVTTILSYVVMVRGMSKDDFGVFNLLYAFIPVVSTVASLGLEQVLRRYQPEYLRAGNKVAAAWLYRVVASGRFATNILVIAIVLLTWNYVAPVFKLGDHRHAFIVFSLLILLYFQARILQLALGSHMMHRYSVGSMALLSAVKLIAYALLVWQKKLTLENAIIADTIAYAVAYGCMRIAYNRQCLTPDARGTYRPEPEERKRLVRYGIYNNFNDAGVLLLYSTLDNFFIAAFIDTVSVGIYAFYTRLNQMTQSLLPVRLFDNIVQPMFFALPPEDADRKIPEYFSFLLNTNLLLQLPVLAFSVAYHAELVQVVFGGKFIEYSWMLPVVVGFATVNVIADPATLVAQYEEKVGVVLASKLFALYNIGAMAVLVPSMGILGATLASGSAQAFKNIYIWWHVRHRAIWINARAVLLSSLLLWGGAVALCIGLKWILPVHPLIHMVLGAAVIGVAMLGYLRSPALCATDRSMVASVAPARLEPLLRKFGVLAPVR